MSRESGGQRLKSASVRFILPRDMSEYWAVLSAALPIFGVIGVGLVLRKINWLTEEADQSLLRLVVNLLLPALILDSILGNEGLSRWGVVLVAPLVGFATVSIGCLIALACAKYFGLAEKRSRRTFAFSVGIYNYGYIPIPLVQLLFDRETLGVLFVHNLGTEIAIWTVALSIMAGGTMRESWRKIINPPVIVVLIGLALNFSGASPHMPTFALTSIKMLGACAVPVALLLIGATIADNLREFRIAEEWETVVGACILRMAVIPILFLALAIFLPVSDELKRVIVIQSAMPAAVLPIVIASHYGGDVRTALRVVLATSTVGLVTIPMVIRLGLTLTGL